MPLYEFDCPGCGRPFEKRVKISEIESVICPTCGSAHVRKRLPTISVKGQSGMSTPATAAPAPGGL